MSKLVDNSITIYEAMQNIEKGKYVMPAFQRQYVWTMEQIEKLWDSILLGYPISTFLFWNVDASNVTWDTYFCNFLPSVVFDSRKQADNINYSLTAVDFNRVDIAVLDGQQRLSSLYLSLFGETNIRPNYSRRNSKLEVLTKLIIELDKNKLGTDEDEYNNKKFGINFTDKIGKISPTQFEIRNIMDEKFRNDETRRDAIETAIENVPEDSKEYARQTLLKLYYKIFVDKLIRYVEIKEMNQDDALEMFIRFNSGGKALKKSEITMSILEVYWPNAKIEVQRILTEEYEDFSVDFIIRAALMIFGNVQKTIINKSIVDNLKNNWQNFRKALYDMKDLFKKMNVDLTRFAHNFSVIIPILYYIYNNAEYEKDIEIIKIYLFRAIFFRMFTSGHTTLHLHNFKNCINENDMKLTIEMLDQIGILRVADGKIEDILNTEKSRYTEDILYYLANEWVNNELQYKQENLQPENCFRESKPYNVSVEQWAKWRSMRNRLPNLYLLDSNNAGNVNNVSLADYYYGMKEEERENFFKQAIISQDEYLEFDQFEKFYETRKQYLKEKIYQLLVP